MTGFEPEVRTKSALIVDDDDFTREVLSGNLQSLGVTHVMAAQNGKLALQLLSSLEAPPDFLICDVFMPDMDGFELLDQLVEQQFKGKVLLTSGKNLDTLNLAAYVAREGGLDFLGAFAKPVKLEALKHSLGLSLS